MFVIVQKSSCVERYGILHVLSIILTMSASPISCGQNARNYAIFTFHYSLFMLPPGEGRRWLCSGVCWFVLRLCGIQEVEKLNHALNLPPQFTRQAAGIDQKFRGFCLALLHSACHSVHFVHLLVSAAARRMRCGGCFCGLHPPPARDIIKKKGR